MEASDKSDHVSEDQVQNLQNIANQVKKDLIAELRQGRSFEELSATEKSFEKKIETVKFLSPNHSRVVEEPFCLGRRANAFYDPLSHAMIICPRLAIESPGAITQFLGHELTHALSPCVLKNDIYRVNTAMLIQKRKELGILSPFKKSELDEMIRTAQSSGRVSLGADALHDPQSLFPPGSLTKEISGAEMADYPFKKAYTCFVKPPFSFRTGQGTNPVSAEPFSQSNGKYECDSTNQMGEVMSDWMGAKLLGRYFDRNPQSSDRQLFAAFSIYYPQVCPMPPPEVSVYTQGVNALMKKFGQTPKTNYPSQDDRLTKIFMTEPSIRRAFGCEETTNTCFDPISSVSSGKGSRAKSSGRATSR